MSITAETRMLEAHRSLAGAERRIREYRDEEITALNRRDYYAATTAATHRQLWQEVYGHAASVIVRGGK